MSLVTSALRRSTPVATSKTVPSLAVVRLKSCHSQARTCPSVINRYISRLSGTVEYNSYEGAASWLERTARAGDSSDQNESRKLNAVTMSAKGKTKKRLSAKNEWIKPEGLDTGIMIYNSLTRKKEPLILPAGRLATWYCVHVILL